jgi:hypothetical protein
MAIHDLKMIYVVCMYMYKYDKAKWFHKSSVHRIVGQKTI